MKARLPCGHNTFNYIEHATWFTEHTLDKDSEWSHYNSEGDYTGKASVQCMECDRIWRFGPNQKRPEWFNRLHDEATNPYLE